MQPHQQDSIAALAGSRTLERGKRTALAAVILSLLTSGCLFTRVKEVKSQACAFDENFEVRFGEYPTIVMKEPVLLDSDILWLVGAEPTYRMQMSDTLLMRYEIEEDLPAPNPDNDLRIDLEFVHIDDEFKLSRVLLDPRASRFFNESFLDDESLLSAAQEVCDAGLAPSITGMDINISEEEIAMLPTRQEVIDLVGPPHALSEDKTGWIYGYRLKGNRDEGNAQFTVWFDADGQQPIRFESRYSRYRTVADLESKKLSMDIDL